MTRPRVMVIGGGLAGLASAVSLAEAGARVTLYERRSLLGGRASSFVHPTGGVVVDNCQHVLLGCCTNLLDFYRKLKVDQGIAFQKRIPFIDEENRLSELYSARLPAPFHLIPSLLKLDFIGWRDKWSIARVVLSMIVYTRKGSMAGEGRSCGYSTIYAYPAEQSALSFLDWLHAHQATPRSISAFWRPFLISALNDELDDIAVDYGITTVVKAFLLNRTGYEVGLPTVPLSDLYVPATAFIEQSGGQVMLDTGVSALSITDDRVASITCSDGVVDTADAYVVAVPFDVLLKLLPDEVVDRFPYFTRLRQLEVSPITAIHVWFDRPVTDLAYVAVLGRTIQWVFNQSIRSSESAGAYLGLVVSASDEWMKLSQQEIVRRALEELQSLFPSVKEAQLLKAIVVKEGRATFAPKPGSQALRPGPVSPVAGLYVAGDWTQTGWPATMESAVRSGYGAAEAVLADIGTPEKILQPDLPVDGLMRWVVRN